MQKTEEKKEKKKVAIFQVKETVKAHVSNTIQ